MRLSSRLLVSLSLAITLTACGKATNTLTPPTATDTEVTMSTSSSGSDRAQASSAPRSSTPSASSRDSSASADNTLPVTWITPEKVRTTDFLDGIGQTERLKEEVRKAFREAGYSIAGEKQHSSENQAVSNDFIVDDTKILERLNTVDLRRVGTVTSGRYGDADVFVWNNNCFTAVDWPCTAYYAPAFRLLKLKDRSIVLLSRLTMDISSTPDLTPGISVTVDATSTMDIETPAMLAIPNARYALKKIGTSHEFVAETEKRFLFHSMEIDKDIYEDLRTNCIIVASNDGTTSIYEIDYMQSKPKENTYVPGNATFVALSILWSDGTKSDGGYTHGRFSCDPHLNCYNVATVTEGKLRTEVGDFELRKIGVTSGNEDVYEEAYTAKDLEKFHESNMRDLSQTYMYFFVENGQKKPLPQEFYASHPVIYFKDPFGRWLRWMKEEYLPAAECGKPVIYLYPTKTQMVDVQVAPNKGLTVSDPPYGKGWHVQATPESVLTTDDGNTFPYLFWEGITNNYRAPKQGFVIAAKDIPQFLDEKLTLLGLNAKERRDFLDFWAPKMQEKPYYFVTFVPQAIFEQLAPLSVSPKPDTVIRVFMDYRGLDAPIDVEPLTIKTPKRRGFTVVEWGGALNRE